LAHIVAIPFTGCGINPARSFGPAAVSGDVEYLWIFIVAPAAGSFLASLTGKLLFRTLDGDNDDYALNE
jgi:glycerol uptake facilitator-like aquaporin